MRLRDPAFYFSRPIRRAGAPTRNAVVVLESVTAILLLGALLLLIAQTLYGLTRHVQRHQERAYALQTAENLMELASVAPWDQLDAESLAAVTDDYLRDFAAPIETPAVSWSVDEVDSQSRWLTVVVAWNESEPALKLSMLRTHEIAAGDAPSQGASQ